MVQVVFQEEIKQHDVIHCLIKILGLYDLISAYRAETVVRVLPSSVTSAVVYRWRCCGGIVLTNSIPPGFGRAV